MGDNPIQFKFGLKSSQNFVALAYMKIGDFASTCNGRKVDPFAEYLWSLLIYYMSLFASPACIDSQLEKNIRDYLWSKHDYDNGLHGFS